MRRVWLFLIAGIASGAIGSCAGFRGAGGDRPELALKRGSAWATYTVQLPYIKGRAANLKLEDGRLRGLLGSRTMDVKIEDDGASGFGPGGPVALTVSREGDETRVDGLWNGGPVNLRIDGSKLKGSVVVFQGVIGSDEVSCGYNLEKVDVRGALSGTSTCAGMPQQTRLEVTGPTATVLKPNELIVLLVAALSAPPVSPNERPI